MLADQSENPLLNSHVVPLGSSLKLQSLPTASAPHDNSSESPINVTRGGVVCTFTSQQARLMRESENILPHCRHLATRESKGLDVMASTFAVPTVLIPAC